MRAFFDTHGPDICCCQDRDCRIMPRKDRQMWGSEMVMLLRNKSPQDPPMNISGSKLSEGVSSWRVVRDRHLRELLSCQSRSSPGPGAQGNVSSQTHLATAGHDHISGHQKRGTGYVLISSGGALRACFSLGCWESECRVCICPQDTQGPGTILPVPGTAAKGSAPSCPLPHVQAPCVFLDALHCSFSIPLP